MRKVAIIHFNPLEVYPPVTNLVNYLATRPETEMEVRVFTTNATNLRHTFASPAANIKIIRTGSLPQQSSRKRYATYWRFYMGVLRRMTAWRPDVVLYYETISSFPALVYKRLINPRSRLFVHYHEYVSPEEYQHGMFLTRWFHKWEKKTYPATAWVSHTNETRMADFTRDNQDISIPHKFILPNYPPGAWTLRQPRAIGEPLKIVYVGSLSFEAMYAREFTEWVLQQRGKVLLDIYCVNISGETKRYLEGLDEHIIRYKGACDYYDLPSILPGYDVGVVLYKGIIRNHVIAVSNKVFEYLSCGLDVWYAREMTGTAPYETSGVFPKVIPIDCQSLDRFDWGKALNRDGLTFQPSEYNYEAVFDSLLKMMTEVNEA